MFNNNNSTTDGRDSVPGKPCNTTLDDQDASEARIQLAFSDPGSGNIAVYFLPTGCAATAAEFVQYQYDPSPDYYRFTIPLSQSILDKAKTVVGEGERYLCASFLGGGHSGAVVRCYRAQSAHAAAAVMQKFLWWRRFQNLHAVPFPDLLLNRAEEILKTGLANVEKVILGKAEETGSIMHCSDFGLPC
jgi:hypothetical protein